MGKETYKNNYTKFPNSLLSDRLVISSTKIIYAAIRSFGDFGDGSNCFPTIEQIAERACKSEKTVDRAIKELKMNGYLVWTPGHMGASNYYSFPKETSTTPSRVKKNANKGSRVTHHQSQTENYNQGKLGQYSMKMDGYENCNRCFYPKPMCGCSTGNS